MRYQVDPALLLSEATHVGSAARTLAGMTVAEQLGALREAIPGGSVAAAASGIESSWQTELTELRSQLRTFGEALGAAATTYTQVETAAEQALGAHR